VLRTCVVMLYFNVQYFSSSTFLFLVFSIFHCFQCSCSLFFSASSVHLVFSIFCVLYFSSLVFSILCLVLFIFSVQYFSLFSFCVLCDVHLAMFSSLLLYLVIFCFHF
jgi:hypothetical protein